MKIKWVGDIEQTPEETARNIAHCRALGLPEIGELKRPALAVVGGGPSVADHIQELRDWPGDIWVSGSAYPWALEHGIDATFLTIDQHESLAYDCLGAKRAVVATCCNPAVFHELRNAAVQVFDLHHEGEEANHGATSVTAAPKVALLMGYTDITFFGCDSSFAKQTHAYHDSDAQFRVRVACNGESFETGAAMLMQAEFMALVLRSCPAVFKNRSAGLLRALVETEQDLDYDITHVDTELKTKLQGQGLIAA